MLMMRRSDFSLMMTMELIVCFWNSNVDGSAVEAFSLFPDGDDPLNAMLDNDELICDISDNDEAYGMFIEDNGGPKGTGCQCHQVDHDDPLVLESDFAKKLDEAGIGYAEHQDQNLCNGWRYWVCNPDKCQVGCICARSLAFLRDSVYVHCGRR